MKILSLPTVVLCLAATAPFVGAKVIPINPIADLVLGQQDFITGSFSFPVTSFRSELPGTVVVDPVSRKVFVAEINGDRVLRYPGVAALSNGASAEAVFGKATFTDADSTAGATGSDGPAGLFLDRYGRLWVADYENNRVLVYEAAAYRANGPTADLVFGQPDLATNTSGTTASKMNNPTGVWIDTADNLWVADTGNNRVLRFAGISTKTSGAAANVVLGQPLFTTFVAGAGSTGLQAPESVSVSAAGTLYVTCRDGNRVMRFDNAASLVNNAPANAVLGQPDFATITPGLTAAKFTFPRGHFLTPDDSLWVSDTNNHRLLRFSRASTKASGSAADGVVGQADFTTNTFGTTNRTLNLPRHAPFVDASGSLWVADSDNHRILRFPPDVTAPLLVVTTSVPKTVTKKKLTLKGTASDAYGISKVEYRVNNGPLKTATGTTTWTFSVPLAMGKNKITIFATDSVGNKSATKLIKVKRVPKSSPAALLASGN